MTSVIPTGLGLGSLGALTQIRNNSVSYRSAQGDEASKFMDIYGLTAVDCKALDCRL
jgi:hypothetical protein